MALEKIAMARLKNGKNPSTGRLVIRGRGCFATHHSRLRAHIEMQPVEKTELELPGLGKAPLLDEEADSSTIRG